MGDPAVVNLNERCPYFYELGMKLSSLTNDRDMGDTLQRALAERYKQIIDKSHNSSDISLHDFVTRLTVSEKELFDAKSSSMLSYGKWKRRNRNVMKMSSFLPNSKKRKQPS
eukprot:TRINITY_DN4955_c0_g2_i3.p1 TRINITY_DN4955_c0_g2~~TRINITY_DN4955_c0_g2_i3.p1  ORF type:complete len:122 (+),score=27.26 TRINITY_DN4955_c0_g2_i3:33-368(+)